jgi:dihydrofolate reductase
MQTTLDGFIASRQGGLEWMTWDWDERLKQHVNALHASVDCILLGRVLAEGFIPAWAERMSKPGPEVEFARKMTETPKIVFSRTVKESKWPHTTIAQGSLPDEVARLKATAGGDIIAYGGGSFVAELTRHDLIDEFHFFVNPVALGAGMTIFRDEDRKVGLKLVGATPFECGIVELVYAPAR